MKPTSDANLKLPIWVVRTLLVASILALPAAAMVFWIVWPNLTAREFIAHVQAGRFEDANGMLESPAHWVAEPGAVVGFVPAAHSLPDVRFTGGDWQWWFARENLCIEQRQASDLIDGSRRFTALEGYFEFTVKRGRVFLAKSDQGRRAAIMRKYNRDRLGLPSAQ